MACGSCSLAPVTDLLVTLRGGGRAGMKEFLPGLRAIRRMHMGPPVHAGNFGRPFLDVLFTKPTNTGSMNFNASGRIHTLVREEGKLRKIGSIGRK